MSTRTYSIGGLISLAHFIVFLYSLVSKPPASAARKVFLMLLAVPYILIGGYFLLVLLRNPCDPDKDCNVHDAAMYYGVTLLVYGLLSGIVGMRLKGRSDVVEKPASEE